MKKKVLAKVPSDLTFSQVRMLIDNHNSNCRLFIAGISGQASEGKLEGDDDSSW